MFTNPTFLQQVSLPVFLVLFSTGFVHVVAPQVILGRCETFLEIES